MILYPDGREEEIRRRGLPSVLEQKSILGLGEALKIDTLVSEMMSIRPEAGYVESVQMMKPQILVITNVRLDHTAQMGTSREQIARGYAASIPRGGTVFIPQNEFWPVYSEVAARLKTEVVQVSKDSLECSSSIDQEFSSLGWEGNTCLALAVADFLELDRNVSFQGMKKVEPDYGSLRMWKVEGGSPPQQLDCVSCFAANDPESTRLVLSKLKREKEFERKKWIGLLNLRKDRGDRTLQWLDTLREGGFPEFRRIYLIGVHASAFKRKFGDSGNALFDVLRGGQPDKLTSQILQKEGGDCVLVGMGNIGGTGRELVDYWEKVGTPHDL